MSRDATLACHPKLLTLLLVRPSAAGMQIAQLMRCDVEVLPLEGVVHDVFARVAQGWTQPQFPISIQSGTDSLQLGS